MMELNCLNKKMVVNRNRRKIFNQKYKLEEKNPKHLKLRHKNDIDTLQKVKCFNEDSKRHNPVLCIVGSLHFSNLKLIEKTVESGVAKEIFLDPKLLIDGFVKETVVESTETLLKNNNNIIIHTHQNLKGRNETRQYGKKKKLNDEEIELMINKGMQKLLKELMGRYRFSGFVIVGSSTAFHFLKNNGGLGFQFFDEIDHDMICGTIIGGSLNGIKVITKPGSLCSSKFLVKSIDYLQSENF